MGPQGWIWAFPSSVGLMHMGISHMGKVWDAQGLLKGSSCPRVFNQMVTHRYAKLVCCAQIQSAYEVHQILKNK